MDEIESLYKSLGKKFKEFINYFKKNGLKNDFLEALYSSYTADRDICFIRSNNPCELFNKYLGIIYCQTEFNVGPVFCRED